ncbi:uncharacterized protein EDB91DRAFT_1142923 [Suillus paluster]|uniref:uncharacterized protein n=1 Tax=Suillus paluster TaxID=48578 RepID=UPI001B872EB2|nr:uncharacterized protein EDB91DRAFT_1142923 [Suillus paluster]KAG1736117.1 hypothetical protein EDB91DRAFT_1142923 [Suillus paluster]
MDFSVPLFTLLDLSRHLARHRRPPFLNQSLASPVANAITRIAENLRRISRHHRIMVSSSLSSILAAAASARSPGSSKAGYSVAYQPRTHKHFPDMKVRWMHYQTDPAIVAGIMSMILKVSEWGGMAGTTAIMMRTVGRCTWCHVRRDKQCVYRSKSWTVNY